MRTVALGNPSVRSSVLGFGCVKLTTHKSRADAVRMLEHALDRGVMHFDVARLYGFGQAEGIVGEFIRGKRGRVTVATKFGMRPNQAVAKHRRLIGVARRVLRMMPAIERRIKKRVGGMVQTGVFTAKEAAESLEISLRELGTDYVDLLLLHEATGAEASNPELIGYLDEQVSRGRVRVYGPASPVSKLGLDLAAYPPGCRVFQFDSTALMPTVGRMKNAEGKGLITFGVMSPMRSVIDYARASAGAVRGMSDEAGLDLSDPAVLAGMLVDDAVRRNPNGVTLVSTASPEHLSANVRAAEGDLFTAAQRAVFGRLLCEAAGAAGIRN